MISGINLSEVVSFSCKNDAENPTVWKLGIIPSYLFSKMTSGANNSETAFRLLQLTIKGWENFGGIQYVSKKEKFLGEELEMVPLELIQAIPMPVLTELSQEVIRISKLTEDEKKN